MNTTNTHTPLCVACDKAARLPNEVHCLPCRTVARDAERIRDLNARNRRAMTDDSTSLYWGEE